MYKIVYAKLNNVRKFHKYIKNCDYELNDKDDLDKLLNTVPEEDKLKFLKYSALIFDTIISADGSAWDPAELVECDLRGKSLTNYVLSGRFSECCDKGEFLDDNTMCYINKDVHSRIYTLLVNGCFD